MAFFTIEKRLRRDGTARYRCTVAVKKNGIYGHSRFCNTDFDDKLACLNLSGV